MNVGGLRFGRLTDAERDRLLCRARRASVNYDHEGRVTIRVQDGPVTLPARALAPGAGSVGSRPRP